MDHEKRKPGFPNLMGKTKTDAVKISESKPSDDFINRPTSKSLDDDDSYHLPIDSTSSKADRYGTLDDGITNNISADLTERDKKQVYEAIELIRRKLSFAKDFTEEERENLMRLGKSGRRFVEKAQNLVDESPGILPRSFDLEEFTRDAELYQELGKIADELHRLAERVADTEAAVGSDAFTASLVVYQSGKLARTGDDMDNHLAGWRRKKASDSVFD
jgi:hypothetical protein